LTAPRPDDDLDELRERFARSEAERERLERELVRLHDQLLHPQRMEAVGTLAAGLAHDMNNVLGSITTLAELLLDQCTDNDTRGDLETIVAQADRGAELTRNLLAFSRKGQYRKQLVPIDEVIRRLLLLLEHTLPKSIEVRAEQRARAAVVNGDPVQLNQVLVNLSLNAADAMNGTGTITISSEVLDRVVRLRVRDRGCGMDEATQRRVFEPFFTTKPPGSGTGLGLSLVWGVVKNHDGTITVESVPGQGTTFTIDLPLVDAAAVAPAQPPARRARRPTSSTTILVIDDEAALRSATRRALERFGYKVLDACHGAEGLEQFDQHRDQIGLVILDMGMPNMNGVECFRRLRERSRVPVLIATGYTDDEDARQLVAAGAGLIEKPYASTALVIAVTQLLRRDPAQDGPR